VEEIIVVDDHSQDDTVEVAKAAAPKTRVLPLPWTVKDEGFGKSVTFMLDQATQPHALMIDCDERLEDPGKLFPLLGDPEVKAWMLPRRKWTLRKGRLVRTEFEAYPDWQPRLIRTGCGLWLDGEIHFRVRGVTPQFAYRGPHIEHYQEVFLTEKKRARRDAYYQQLADRQGVTLTGGYGRAP